MVSGGVRGGGAASGGVTGGGAVSGGAICGGEASGSVTDGTRRWNGACGSTGARAHITAQCPGRATQCSTSNVLQMFTHIIIIASSAVSCLTIGQHTCNAHARPISGELTMLSTNQW